MGDNPLERAAQTITGFVMKRDTLTQTVGFIATAMSFIQFFSGSLTARRVWNAKTTGDMSPVPFVAGVLGSCLWFLYSILLNDRTMVFTNSVGIILNTIYVGVFFAYSNKRMLLARQIFGTILGISIIAMYIRSFGVDETELAKNNLGMICTMVSLPCIASPLVGLRHVIRTKSTDSLPFPLISCVFTVCLLWWIYGILISDFYMQLTNFLGTLITLVQLSLFFIYPSQSVHYDKLSKNSIT